MKKAGIMSDKNLWKRKKTQLFRVQNIDVAKRVNDMHSINYMFLPQLIVVFQSQDIAENVSLCIGRSNAHTTLVPTHPAQNSKRKSFILKNPQKRPLRVSYILEKFFNLRVAS